MLRCTVEKLKDVPSLPNAASPNNIMYTFKWYESVIQTKVHKKSKAMLLADIISYPLLLILSGYFPTGQE